MDTNIMSGLKILDGRLSIPVIAAPLFIISNPALVIAQCKAGIVGSFPALNARPSALLDEWLAEITETLASYDRAHPDAPSAPFSVNQIVHRSNDRLEHDVEMCVKYRVPIVITSLGARVELNDAIHSYGGVTLHDVIDTVFARKAIDKGADGLIAVATGAGGHAGRLSPFPLCAEIREWFDGPLALSGAISTGGAVLAAQAMGADYGYIGSAFIATTEAAASDRYKQALVDGQASDITYTNLFTGVHGNYLRQSIENAGLDPDNLPESDPTQMDFGSSNPTGAKAWRDIWGCGQGIGAIKATVPTKTLVSRLQGEYAQALRDLAPRETAPIQILESAEFT
jgi:nitronate monooxygenase